jgi:hypothetical protein
VLLLTFIASSALTTAQDFACGAIACDAQCDCSASGCDACDDRAGSCRHDHGLCDRWFEISRSLEDCGIKFEGELSQFYQGVSSGGLQREFRYGGHGEYNVELDFGKICGWDVFLSSSVRNIDSART